MSKPGDVIVFLKRSHELVSDDLLLIRPHPKHVQRLCQLLKIGSRKPKAAPMPLNIPEDGASLEAEDAATFRAAVGALLYLAPDVIPAQNAIRWLSQRMSAPTTGAMKVCKHLVSYLKGTCEHSIGLSSTEPGLGALHGARTTVMSLSCSLTLTGQVIGQSAGVPAVMSFMHNNHTVCTASRTQKSVSLSSCESEFNAYVSGVTDLVYVSAAVSFLTGIEPDRHTFLDSSSARQLVSRQGVGRVRHLQGKLLWVQEFLKHGYMQIHPVDTLINVSDLGTKPLAPERVAALSFLIGLRDGDCSPLASSSTKLSRRRCECAKLCVRCKKRPAVRQADMLQHAFRIAVILNEIQEVGALGQSATLIRVWSCFRAALFVLCILCCFLLQGCEGYDDEYDAFRDLDLELCQSCACQSCAKCLHPYCMWLLPCVYACIACCTSRKQVIEVKICGDAKDVHKSCANNERDDEAQASSDVPRSFHRALSGPSLLLPLLMYL